VEGWKTIQGLLAAGWKVAAKRCRALRRRRRIRDPGQLLRVILIYLTGGSLRTAVADAELAGVAVLSDTALMNRMRKATPWLQWLALNLMKHFGHETGCPDWLSGFRVRCLDASVVTRPGSTGTDWRLHFSFGLFDMCFDQFVIAGQEIGESFRNFSARSGDLLLADSGYAHLSGLRHVIEQGGDFLVRLYYRAFALYDVRDGHKINLLNELQHLTPNATHELWTMGRSQDGSTVRMRVCVRRLDRRTARNAQNATLRRAKRKGERLSPEALRFHQYVVVATSVGEDRLTAEQVLSLYRMRWQIELAIKRLKTIIGVSQLPCRRQESGQAWLQGKLVLALLVQVLMNRGQELRLVEDGTPNSGTRDESNLWREMCMLVMMVSTAVREGNNLQQYVKKRRRTWQKLRERSRKRRYQHELLLS